MGVRIFPWFRILTLLTDDETAKEEFRSLISDLEDAGLQTEVRAGEDHSLLVFVRVPTELLNDTMHKSR